MVILREAQPTEARQSFRVYMPNDGPSYSIVYLNIVPRYTVHILLTRRETNIAQIWGEDYLLGEGELGDCSLEKEQHDGEGESLHLLYVIGDRKG